MRDLYEPDEALAEHAFAHAHAFSCTRNGFPRDLAWEIAGCIAGLVLAVLSAPAFWN
jgi:hypothetical protein